MLPSSRIPTHPGEVLLHEYLIPMGLTQRALADKLKLSVQSVNLMVKGRRSITADTAWRLSRTLKTSPEFWMNLQVGYDLAVARSAQRVRPA